MIELQKQDNHDYLTSSSTLHIVPLSRLEKKFGSTQKDF